MAKVELKGRRTVEAVSQWFTVNANETHINVRTEFGVVQINRTNKGLEIDAKLTTPGESFLEFEGGDGVVHREYKASETVTTRLRPFGLTNMAEMTADETLAGHVRKWLAKRLPKP